MGRYTPNNVRTRNSKQSGLMEELKQGGGYRINPDGTISSSREVLQERGLPQETKPMKDLITSIESLTLKVNAGQESINALTTTVKDLTETINGSKSDMLEQAFATGKDLIELKALVKEEHGPIWTEWAKEHVTIIKQQYTKYMKLAKYQNVHSNGHFTTIDGAIAHINKQLKLEKQEKEAPVSDDDDAATIAMVTHETEPAPKAKATVTPIKEKQPTKEEIEEMEKLFNSIKSLATKLEIFEEVFTSMEFGQLVKVGQVLEKVVLAKPTYATIKL